jgi:hypothetical protein
MNIAQQLFQDCADPAMSDVAIRSLVTLAHSENLWVSLEACARHWLIDGPGDCVTVPYGASYAQWRVALLRAAGV